MEEIIFLILGLISLLIILSIYKILDKRGLYFSLILMNLLSLVLSFKISVVFKMNINLNIISILGILIILFIFNKKYGIKESKKILKITLISNITTACLLLLINYYIPAITETISINIEGVFKYNYKILIFFPLIMCICQYIILKMYNFLSKINNNDIMSIILTYIITSLIFTIISSILFYINIMEISNSILIGIETYIIGLINIVVTSIIITTLIKKKVII